MEALSPFREGAGSFPKVKWEVPALIGGSLGAFLILLWVFWLGYIGSDDTNYWENAGKWLEQFPVVGNDHFAARWTLVLPIAACRRIFGDVPVSLFLPTTIYAMGVILILVLWLHKRAGAVAAIAGAAFIATNVQLVVDSSTATIDIAEAFFVSLALFSFDEAAENKSDLILFISGVSLGFGMLSRETTSFVVLTFGILFLAGFAINRWRYFVLGAGFAAIELAEMAFYWIYSGDPFHRWAFDANHAAISPVNRWLDQGAGVPIIHPLVDPVTMVFLNHYFGLCAWIGLPLATWLLLQKDPDRSIRRTAVLVASVATIWSVLAAGLWHQLTLIPRYFFFPSLAVSFLAALAIGRLWASRQQRLAALLGAFLVAGNLVGLVVDNRNFMFGERELVALASTHQEVIHTDKATLMRAKLLLAWHNMQNRVTDAPPKPGDLFLFNPPRTNGSVLSGEDWTSVTQAKPEPPFALALVMRAFPRVLPHGIVARLIGHPGVTLYRVEP